MSDVRGALPNPPLQRTGLRPAAERQYRSADIYEAQENTGHIQAAFTVRGQGAFRDGWLGAVASCVCSLAEEVGRHQLLWSELFGVA